jgi:hypothetical protein
VSKVWAVMKKRMGEDTGEWVKGSWEQLILFSSLGDLVGQLRKAQIPKLEKLGIVAHGDANGVVQLERDLTAESASSFNSEFSALSGFMEGNGRLIFFSCVAGGREPGTKLLNILSGSFLRDRYVIGFEVVGYIAPGGLHNSPGGVLADLSPLQSKPNLVQADQTGDKHLTEHSWYSKWSFNGQIIRLPFFEQDASTMFGRMSYGVKSAREAIRNHLSQIDYVAIEKDKAASPPLRGVVDAFGPWAHVKNKLKFMSRHELDHLARTRQHEGAVVIWTQNIRLLKCANPACPGHSEPWHFCTEFLKRFKNGPLVWP